MTKKLDKYNEKRNFNKTFEPYGKLEKKRNKLRFVVQHHIARRDHYDVRLEMGGVMKSWAVPKGPSYNTKDKRLAVHVEDHPLSYRNFEGTIPEGEYGAGTVMVWDEGTYSMLENSYDKGYLKFELHGKRLKGAWTLVKFKDENWLLIKEKDGVALFNDINSLDTSVKTGRTMDEIANQKKSGDNIKIELTNPQKIMYPKNKITKKEVYEYYKRVSNRMLPYVQNRIFSTVRCPGGVTSEKFFKKHFGENKYLCKKNIKNKEGKTEDYYYIERVEGLLYEVQMNGLEFHISGANANDMRHPNMLVFDLDPDEGLSLKKLRDGVRDLKSILDNLNLASFLKTSGGKGYHIVVPIYWVTWKSFEKIAKTIAELMVTKYPDKYTINMSKRARKGKIFIDYLRNKKGATCVAPYSLRARDKARVSMPIKWSELDKVKPDEINIYEAIKSLKRKDPWEDF